MPGFQPGSLKIFIVLFFIKSGALEVGDEIYEINGVSVSGSRIEDILTLLVRF